MTFYESLEAAAAQNTNINDVRVQYGTETISLRSQFGLWLNKGSPTIGKPETEPNLVYVPGSDKVLNLTRSLDGKVHYKRRIISMELTVLRPKEQWRNIRHVLDTFLQGQWLRFYFTRDGELWDGLFDIEMKPSDFKATVSITVTCDPLRKGTIETTPDTTSVLGQMVLGVDVLGSTDPETAIAVQALPGYQRQNFRDGNVLYADQLNRMDTGIAGIESQVDGLSEDLKALGLCVRNGQLCVIYDEEETDGSA